jgi:serine/threonine protein kinase/Tol biopolymer transport system component
MAYKSLFGSDPSDLKRLVALGMEDSSDSKKNDAEPNASYGIFGEKPGDWIGAYKLTAVLGEGGMGIVYRAEQRRPIRRQVAIKLIKPGMDSRSIIARFEAEQQALALMAHPNIAQVYDAGLTDNARPYFAMEYVKGVPITEHCDKHRLTVTERLILFVDVCKAVQHAHHKGIIHRDLKPSNILIAFDDDKSIVKIIDFGVARAIHQPLTDRTLITRGGQLLGTPEYMSPEQADLSNQDIDTRTDIYSLGIILYELLTGVLPFASETLRSGGIEQIRKIICEEPPKTPSTRLSTISCEELEKLALLRRTNGGNLSHQLRGDMDWISIKALEKNRNRRYETAGSLAQDIERHLRREPVSAVPPSISYRFQRYIQRHRSQAIATALACLLVIVVAISLFARHKYITRSTAFELVMHQNKLIQAREYFMQLQFADSLALIRPLITSRHVGSEARLLYAALLVEGKHEDQAITELEKLAAGEPELAGVAHSLLTRIYWESGLKDQVKLTKATYHRRQAESIMPKTAEAYFLLALTTPVVKETLHYVDAAIELDPSHYESRKLHALVDYASGHYEQMREHAEILIALRPNEAFGFSLKATALSQLGDYNRAIDNYERALNLIPVDDARRIELAYRRNYTCLLAERNSEVISSSVTDPEVSDNIDSRFCRFWAHVGLGNYTVANQIYEKIKSSGSETMDRFKGLSRKYVFDILSTGRSWYSSPEKPSGPAYRILLEADRDYMRYSVKAQRLLKNAFEPALSPDGKRLAFSIGSRGNSGLAIMDLETQSIELLMRPGRDPDWSPTGEHLAFVRDRHVLPLTDFLGSEAHYQPRSVTKEEVWIIKADGTEPRLIAKGSRPSWSADGKAIYYYSRIDLKHYMIKIDEVAPPVPVLDYYNCTYCFPSVSKNEKYITYVQDDTLKILDLSLGRSVAQWPGPPDLWISSWDPDNERIWLGGGDALDSRTGLWLYDLKSKSGVRIMPGPITSGQRSPASEQVVFCIGQPLYEIWFVDTDDKESSFEQVTLNQHRKEMTAYYTKILENDPSDATSAVLLKAYESQITNGSSNTKLVDKPEPFQFGQVENLGATINSNFNEGTPFITRDGQLLFFTSNRPEGEGAHDIWVSKCNSTDGSWTSPVNLGPTINGPGQDFFPCVSSDGLSLYFFSEREGGYGNGDIWVSTRQSLNDVWPESVNVGPPINGPYFDSAPHISPDGLEFYFTSNRGGGLDLWVASRINVKDNWSEPRNLGPTINSNKVDSCPFLSADGLYLFFNSKRGGQQDLYWTSRATKTNEWSATVSLGPNVNSECGETCACLSPDFDYLYFCECVGSALRYGGLGGTDIWRVPINRK